MRMGPQQATHQRPLLEALEDRFLLSVSSAFANLPADPHTNLLAQHRLLSSITASRAGFPEALPGHDRAASVGPVFATAPSVVVVPWTSGEHPAGESEAHGDARREHREGLPEFFESHQAEARAAANALVAHHPHSGETTAPHGSESATDQQPSRTAPGVAPDHQRRAERSGAAQPSVDMPSLSRLLDVEEIVALLPALGGGVGAGAARGPEEPSAPSEHRETA